MAEVRRQARTGRAVVVSDFWFGATARDLADGLRLCGWDVAEVDLFDYVLISDLPAIKLAGRFLNKFSAGAYGRAILRAASNIDADLMLTVKGSYLRADTLRTLAKRGVFRANLYPDFHFDHPEFDEALFHDYDFVATTKSFQVEHLANLIGPERVAYVPHGYSGLIHHDRPFLDEDQLRWDIGYAGNASAHKRDWLLAVARAFPDRSMRIVGGGWTALAKGTELEPFVLGHALTGDFFARFIQECRINLAVHFGEHKQGGWQDLTSTRTFEIPAYRGFMLHVDNPEVRTLFDVGSEIDVFDSQQQLIERISFYLDRPELRRAMIKRAHARCVPAYSVQTRAAELDRLIRPRLKR
ncbi:MAG: glycosyltransferase [Sphingomonas sp.]